MSDWFVITHSSSYNVFPFMCICTHIKPQKNIITRSACRQMFACIYLYVITPQHYMLWHAHAPFVGIVCGTLLIEFSIASCVAFVWTEPRAYRMSIESIIMAPFRLPFMNVPCLVNIAGRPCMSGGFMRVCGVVEAWGENYGKNRTAEQTICEQMCDTIYFGE